MVLDWGLFPLECTKGGRSFRVETRTIRLVGEKMQNLSLETRICVGADGSVVYLTDTRSGMCKFANNLGGDYYNDIQYEDVSVV